MAEARAAALAGLVAAVASSLVEVCADRVVVRAAALAGLVAAVASALVEACADRVDEEAVAVIASA